jgi:hypothetical protein
LPIHFIEIHGFQNHNEILGIIAIEIAGEEVRIVTRMEYGRIFENCFDLTLHFGQLWPDRHRWSQRLC